MKYFFIFLIRFYQLSIGLIFPRSCRFYPSCSNYSLEAFHKHSGLKAFGLTIKRISKCHPFHPGGIDLVP